MKDSILNELNKSLKLGTESDDNYNAEDMPTDELVGIDEGETGSAQSIEDIAEETAIDDIADAAEDESDAAEAVEDLVAVVEHAQNNMQKLSRLEAAALKVTFMQITKGHYKNPESLLPARESHQETEFADLALARESLAETGKDFVKKVIEHIKKLFEMAKNFLLKLVNKYAALRQRLQRVYREAKSMNDSSSNSRDLEGSAEAGGRGNITIDNKYLTINGKVDPKTINSAVSGLESISDFIYDYGSKLTGRELSTLDDRDTNENRIFESISKRTKQLIDSIAEVSPGIVENGEGLDAEYVAPLPGEWAVGGKKVADNLIVPVIGSMPGNDKAESKHANVTPATPEEVMYGAKNAIKAIMQAERHANDMSRAFKVDSIIESMLTYANQDTVHQVDSEKRAVELSGEKAKKMQKFATALTTFLQKSANYTYNFLNAAAGYYEQSLKANSAIEG